MAKKKKEVKKNNNDLIFKIVVSIIVISIIAVVFLIVTGGKKIVCTRTISNDKSTIQTAYTFKFDKKNRLSKIKANAILDYSKDDEMEQKDFDDIVNKINNKEKYENIHINKYNKKADINYDVKISAANLGDDLTFNTVLDLVSRDEDLGNCVVK